MGFRSVLLSMTLNNLNDWCTTSPYSGARFIEANEDSHVQSVAERYPQVCWFQRCTVCA